MTTTFQIRQLADRNGANSIAPITVPDAILLDNGSSLNDLIGHLQLDTNANILNIDGNAATATTWKTARTLTIGASGKSINGSANISYTPFEMKLSRALYNTDTNLNAFAQHGHATGMCNLGSNGAVDNPGGKTGWHHVFQATWSDTADNNNSTTNEWCTQIANLCGSTDLYVRSRNGGTISDGTAWSAPWVLLSTIVEKGTYYIRFNSGLQVCWGTVSLPKLGANATGSSTATLAKAFKDTTYGISFVQQTDPGNTWHTGICNVSKTTSSMTVNFRNGYSGALSGTGGVYSYIAIGWWK